MKIDEPPTPYNYELGSGEENYNIEFQVEIYIKSIIQI